MSRILVNEHPDFRFEGVEVFLCPDDFEFDAV
jgi:hypothetical protein